jgi:hypothetical protein
VATLLLTVGATAPAAAAPSATLDVTFAPGSPAPPVLNLSYSYALDVVNNGDVALDTVVVVDTLPVELAVSGVTTGSYIGLSNIAAGEGVRVSYEKNTAPGVFTLWGSSPNTAINTTLTAPPPGLGAGEYLTRVRWEYGQAAPGMRATTRPVVSGRVTNPDRSGGPVAAGDTIQNCATLTAAALTVPRNDCQSFRLIAGPSIAIQAPASTPLGSAISPTATLSGGAPTGSITFRVFATSDSGCTTSLLAGNVDANGVGSYAGPAFTAVAAGGYKWVARYNGDSLHAASATGCNDPAGAFAVVAPPTVAASFDAETITVGESTALIFTIANPAANTVPLTGVALADELPAGLFVASPNSLSGSCGTGTITAAPGSQSVSLAGGTIPVGSSCSFSVGVTASAPGPVTNTTGAVDSANGGTGNTATASLTVDAPPSPPPAPPTTPTPPPAAPAAPPVPTPPIEEALSPAPVAPRTAQALALACAPAHLVLVSATRAGRRVRFRGTADPADAGQQVVIRTSSARTIVARATVLADGSFTATGPRPPRRAVHTTRYRAELGARRSLPLKLTRRLAARLTASTGTVTITGRVAPPLDKPIRRVVVTRLTGCPAGYAVVARARPSARGRFRVTLPRDAGPALYRAQTQVRTKAGGALGTVSAVLWAALVQPSAGWK